MRRTVSGRTEKMPQGNKRNRLFTEHGSAHPQGEQNEVENCSHDVYRQEKGQQYGSPKLANRKSENVQNIRRSCKLHGSQEKLENGINSNFSRG